MIRTIKKQGRTFIVADYDGVKSLRHSEGGVLQMSILTCGHYVYPNIGKFSHQTVECPLCGTTYRRNDFERPFQYMNNLPLEPKIIGIEVIGDSPLKQKAA